MKHASRTDARKHMERYRGNVGWDAHVTYENEHNPNKVQPLDLLMLAMNSEA